MNTKVSLENIFDSKLRGVIPSALRDCSTYHFRRVTFRLYASLSETEFHQ